VEFEFVVEMNLVQIGTNEFFPQLIRTYSPAPYSNQKLGRRDQSAASSELFLSFTRRSFPTCAAQKSRPSSKSDRSKR
jgi:hypothetical protein